MDIWTPVITGIVVALFTAIQTWINKGRFDTLDRKIDYNFEHLSAEIAALRSDLSSEIVALRSDLLQVALAATGRRETG